MERLRVTLVFVLILIINNSVPASAPNALGSYLAIQSNTDIPLDVEANERDHRILIDRHHGMTPPLAYFRTWPDADIQSSHGAITSSLLQSVSLLFIYMYNGEPFSGDEMEAIWQYVSNGGDVFIELLGWSLHSYGKVSPEESSLNVLCEPFGMWFNDDYAKGESKVEDIPSGWTSWKYTHASMPLPELLPGVEWIVTWGTPSSISITPPAFPLIIFQSGGVLLAAAEYGKGKLISMQPSGFYDDSLWLDPGTNGPDNAKLVDNILRWFEPMDVDPSLIASFSATPRAGKAPLAVRFYDLSTGDGITDWLWEFGDGVMSTEQNPSHVYERPGYYNVKLTIMDDEKSDVYTRFSYITVEHLETAELRTAIERFVALEGSRDDWACDKESGMGIFISSIRRIWNGIHSNNLDADEVDSIYTGTMDILHDYPFLRYQAFYGSGDGTYAGTGPFAGLHNDLYLQFMSRWLLLTLVNLKSREGLVADRALWTQLVFPETENGRLGAEFLGENQVLLLGVGFDEEDNVTYLFQDGQLTELIAFFRIFPIHLTFGANERRRLRSITIHNMRYINGIEAFASDCHPQNAGWMGYGSGISLNTAGGPPGSPKTGIRSKELWANGQYDSLSRILRTNSFLIIFAHELMHMVHSTVEARRDDYKTKLNRLLDLGVEEEINIRDVDFPPSDNFAGTSMPAYRWFKEKAPQEFVATMANVLFVDSETVLEWAVAIAQEREAKLQPLNHILWFIDALSLDESYKETISSLLFTIQPEGSHIKAIPLRLHRDAQGRISSIHWMNGSLRVEYNAEGWAKPVERSYSAILGDMNADSRVDILDLILVARNIGKQPESGVSPNPDVNCDGTVNTLDIILVAKHFGEVHSPAAPSRDIWKVDREHLPLLTELYESMEENPSSDPDFLSAKSLLQRLISNTRINKTDVFQNYPNPLNPDTWIPYQLREDSHVIIKIYTSTGRLVRTLNLGHKSAGIYANKENAAYWDGKNEEGEKTASGIYFYRIQAGDFTSKKKMAIVE